MNQLTKALNEVKPWAAKSSAMPVLENVKLEASDVLILTTTDLEAMAVTTMPYEGRPFATTVNLKKLMAVTKGMTNPTFEVNTKEVKNWKGEESTVETLVVADGNTKATLNTIPVSEWLLTPERGEHLGTLDLAGIDRVWSFTAKDNRRPVLECVLFELGDNARLVATDGFKLATLTKDYSGKPMTLLVPANSLKKLKRKNMEATISATDKHVRFRMNNFSLTVTLLDQTYPDYQQIIPNHHDCSFEVDVKEWFAALKVVSLFAKETVGIVTHTVDDVLTVSAKDGNGNLIERTVPVERNGDIPPFALGLKHIETTLKACQSPTVKLLARRDEDGQLLPTTDPLVFEDGDWKAVVMPMNVDRAEK